MSCVYFAPKTLYITTGQWGSPTHSWAQPERNLDAFCLRLTCFNMPTSSSSTLCCMPDDVSINLASREAARVLPSVRERKREREKKEGEACRKWKWNTKYEMRWGRQAMSRKYEGARRKQKWEWNQAIIIKSWIYFCFSLSARDESVSARASDKTETNLTETIS